MKGCSRQGKSLLSGYRSAGGRFEVSENNGRCLYILQVNYDHDISQPTFRQTFCRDLPFYVAVNHSNSGVYAGILLRKQYVAWRGEAPGQETDEEKGKGRWHKCCWEALFTKPTHTQRLPSILLAKLTTHEVTMLLNPRKQKTNPNTKYKIKKYKIKLSKKNINKQKTKNKPHVMLQLTKMTS